MNSFLLMDMDRIGFNERGDAELRPLHAKAYQPDDGSWNWRNLRSCGATGRLPRLDRGTETGGNTKANLYHWLHTLDIFGQVDRIVTADCPFYAVFQKDGHRAHVAYNMTVKPRVVKFSDGVTLTCGAKSFAVKP